MEINDFKNIVCEILGQKINFLGKDHEHIIQQLSLQQSEKIFVWTADIVSKLIQAIPFRELLAFRYAFSMENNEYRILVVKIKNDVFIEFLQQVQLGQLGFQAGIKKSVFH